jgi:hypothetical protein
MASNFHGRLGGGKARNYTDERPVKIAFAEGKGLFFLQSSVIGRVTIC